MLARYILKIVISFLLILSAQTSIAAYVDGQSLGIFDEVINDGTKAEMQLADLLGIDVSLVTFLGKIDLPSLSNGDFLITTDQDTNEATSGTWTYNGSEFANYITLKAGNIRSGGGLEILFFEDPNMGNWDTLNLDGKGLSNIAAFQVTPVPVPAALPLFMSAIIGMCLVGRRKNSNQSLNT